MKYESDIAEMIHENAINEFKLGLISEEKMREYDEMCLEHETPLDNASKDGTVKIEHPDLATA
jgi:DNA-binding transcriptional regulator YiaG